MYLNGDNRVSQKLRARKELQRTFIKSLSVSIEYLIPGRLGNLFLMSWGSLLCWLVLCSLEVFIVLLIVLEVLWAKILSSYTLNSIRNISDEIIKHTINKYLWLLLGILFCLNTWTYFRICGHPQKSSLDINKKWNNPICIHKNSNDQWHALLYSIEE